MQNSKSNASENSESHESQDIIRFDRSLQELRGLRSQLHNAANHCETTFLNTNQKRMVLESTKEYLCRAVVAVVDHLGCVSANLNNSISNNCAFSEAELRINCLKQRLLSCEKYAHRVALTRVRWNAYLPKHHHRYLSTQISSVEKSNEDARDSNSQAPAKILLAKHEFGAEQLPLFLHTCPQKSASTRNLWSGISTGKGDPNSVVPVRDGLSILSRISNPSFHFQQCSSRNGRSTIFRKSSARSKDIFSLIRRAKRTP
ncbi:PREDICTED: probable protein ABIL5 isoform X2 [Populus euphratica]|uniref:Probable protein ABIL5 isoform X2 n=1 Tax=Populus euphratica TaxID=75702 RepID=A0AAJ6VHA2_POPEU|nr:PREDICTED: probable protein ABIL5 isoform X2 [Populus euphratica]XP_011048393.1 PREDICTED: probable protein ABIL5 isoform X2 [Populus euphratica]